MDIQKSVGAGRHQAKPSLASVPLSSWQKRKSSHTKIKHKPCREVLSPSWVGSAEGSSSCLLQPWAPAEWSEAVSVGWHRCTARYFGDWTYWKPRSRHMEEKRSISTWPASIHYHCALRFDNLDWSKSWCSYQKVFGHIKKPLWLWYPQEQGYAWLCPSKAFNRRYEKLKAKQSLLSVKTEFNGHTNWTMRVTWEG